MDKAIIACVVGLLAVGCKITISPLNEDATVEAEAVEAEAVEEEAEPIEVVVVEPDYPFDNSVKAFDAIRLIGDECLYNISSYPTHPTGCDAEDVWMLSRDLDSTLPGNCKWTDDVTVRCGPIIYKFNTKGKLELVGTNYDAQGSALWAGLAVAYGAEYYKEDCHTYKDPGGYICSWPKGVTVGVRSNGIATISYHKE
jgi:hypothetical protein